ncbi:MAG: 2-amino-4-hydroxy-6-hydroxymethyldihydropteridine diphosphokinase [Myxococcota bacterium]
MTAPRRVAIGFGSSLGPRRRHIERAVRALDRAPGLVLLRCSRLVRTPPMRGGTASGWFLNAVGLYECQLTPLEVLELCRNLENAAGRRRQRYWGDRTLDLDVLLDETCTVRTPSLTVPHPAIAKRPFVFGPLLEVWPDATHPDTGQRYADKPSLSGPMAVACGVLARPG